MYAHQHWVFKCFIKAGTKSLVQTKQQRISGDKFQTLTAKTLIISSSVEKANS